MSNQQSDEKSMILSPRQEYLQRVRDEMAPGEKPAAIVPHTFAELVTMCQALATADLAPKALRGKATDMALVIMTGAEVGLPPMASLRLYTTWDGVPRLMAEGVRAIILQSPAIEYFEMATCSDIEATWIGKRRGRPEKSVTWTIERAKKAMLLEKENWRKYPQDMLNARASMQLGRLIAPDVTAGMVALEEARDGDFVDAQATERPVFVAPQAPVGTFTSGPRVGEPVGAPPGVPRVEVVPPAEQTRRGPGRPPKERPTTPASSSAPSGSLDASSSPVSSGSASTPAASPSAPANAPENGTSSSSKLDAAIRAVEDKIPETVDRWGQAVGPTSSGGSSQSEEPNYAGSAAPSTASTDAHEAADPQREDTTDGFGGADDPPDSEPAAPQVDAALERIKGEFAAFLQGCKSQREMSAGFPAWRSWAGEQYKAGDQRFKDKTGELQKLMGEMWARRKAEVPA